MNEPSRLQRLISPPEGHEFRKARSVAASILLPPVLWLAFGSLPRFPIMDHYPEWPMTAAIFVGWLFLVREFRIYAILFCWAYYWVMFWIVAAVGIFIIMPLFGGYI